MTSQSYLDSIYYFLSALDAEDPMNCREVMDMAFSRCVAHEQYLRSMKHHKGTLSPKDTLRLVCCQYLTILGKIWTKIDLDQLESFVRSCDRSLRQYFENHLNEEDYLTSEVLVRMLVCLLMCVDLCEQEEDTLHHWKDYCEKDENDRPLLFVITSRDLCIILCVI